MEDVTIKHSYLQNPSIYSIIPKIIIGEKKTVKLLNSQLNALRLFDPDLANTPFFRSSDRTLQNYLAGHAGVALSADVKKIIKNVSKFSEVAEELLKISPYSEESFSLTKTMEVTALFFARIFYHFVDLTCHLAKWNIHLLEETTLEALTLPIYLAKLCIYEKKLEKHLATISPHVEGMEKEEFIAELSVGINVLSVGNQILHLFEYLGPSTYLAWISVGFTMTKQIIAIWKHIYKTTELEPFMQETCFPVEMRV